MSSMFEDGVLTSAKDLGQSLADGPSACDVVQERDAASDVPATTGTRGSDVIRDTDVVRHSDVVRDTDEPPPATIGVGNAAADPAAAQRLALELLAVPVWLGGGPLEHMTPAEVLEFLAACDVLEARAAAAKRAAAATLEEQLGSRVHGQRLNVAVSSLAVDEISLRLGISHQRAGTLVGEGELLNGPLIDVAEALALGAIDAAKAGSFARVLCNHSPEIVFAVVETVLPLAPEQAHDRLNRTLNTELIRVDPTAASLRCQRAMELRRLDPVRLHADGMASLRLVGPVFDLATIYTYADATARATKATGDERTLDQLRADTLLAAVTHPDDDSDSGGRGGNGDGGNGGGESGNSAPHPGLCDDSGSAPRLEGDLQQLSFAELSAYDAALCDSRSADSSLLAQTRRLVAQLRARQPRRRRRATPRGQLAATAPPRTPGELETIIPRAPLTRASGPASRLTLVVSRAHVQEPIAAQPCPADLVRDELYGDSIGNTTSPDLSAPSARFTPAVPGRDVPHLLGFGPLTPSVARELLAMPPLHLTITHFEDLEAEHQGGLIRPPEPRRDPSAALLRHVQTYYPTCIAPACSVRATSTDTDHTIEYPVGPTHAGNLRPLCRRHHNLKTHFGHRVIPDAGASVNWVSPLGTRRPVQHQQPGTSSRSQQPGTTSPAFGTSAPTHLRACNPAPLVIPHLANPRHLRSPLLEHRRHGRLIE